MTWKETERANAARFGGDPEHRALYEGAVLDAIPTEDHFARLRLLNGPEYSDAWEAKGYRQCGGCGEIVHLGTLACGLCGYEEPTE